MQNSESLRARLQALEASAADAAQRVISARKERKTLLASAVLDSVDSNAIAQADTILRDAEVQSMAAADMADACRQLLAQVLRDEKLAAQAITRKEVEDTLAEMETEAADIDASFAALAARVMRLRDREIAVRNTVRTVFREAYGGTQYLGALRSVSSYFAALASGILHPPAPKAIALAVESSAAFLRDSICE